MKFLHPAKLVLVASLVALALASEPAAQADSAQLHEQAPQPVEANQHGQKEQPRSVDSHAEFSQAELSSSEFSSQDLSSSDLSSSDLSIQAADAFRASQLHALSRDPEPDGQTYLIRGLEDFRHKSVAELLRNKENSFRISKTSRIVYYDTDADTWYLHHFLRRNRTVSSSAPDTPVRVPVSSCIDMTQSSGGYISPNVEVTVSVSRGLSISAGLGGLVDTNTGAALAQAVSFSGAVTCNVPGGHYAQMFVRPYYHEVPRGRRVPVQYHRKVGLVESGEWEETEPFRELVVRAPLVECAVGGREVCAQ
ncbi:hypothetical protein EJF18_60189 [Clavispora lusitaniae]|uniref:Uncharacterized protein n=1 Tax=Clavispora lusitaniae TaxID=36911 RepID=A0ACD0WRP8_CLALS|nr:hypothetical protein EJF14_60189 [Clavispora lusitaniae]QFZ35327.1 hypothetical protein EJF16_60189 [Clavispora lusitaniae]QFZ41021.1 hypothetical protein EJF15_60189 [Clavispora lusitaniae]QFZ46702.1 hypothetical protein EJF18_60189 [Clavispora lusitaniae]QFZ52367.1 hypothetical protein EJF17_60189 [Clavispora lusitaniae]